MPFEPSHCNIRIKKNFDFSVFSLMVPAYLVENLAVSRIAGC